MAWIAQLYFVSVTLEVAFSLAGRLGTGILADAFQAPYVRATQCHHIQGLGTVVHHTVYSGTCLYRHCVEVPRWDQEEVLIEIFKYEIKSYTYSSSENHKMQFACTRKGPTIVYCVVIMQRREILNLCAWLIKHGQYHTCLRNWCPAGWEWLFWFLAHTKGHWVIHVYYVIFQKRVLHVLPGFPNTRKLMKARGRRPRAFIVFKCLETPVKHEARVFEIASQSAPNCKQKKENKTKEQKKAKIT